MRRARNADPNEPRGSSGVVEESAGLRRLRLSMAAGLSITAAAHVAQRRAFEAQIPSWIPGAPAAWNAVATAAEASAAALLARRSTAAAGGTVAFGTLAVVYVANIDAALKGGYVGLPGWLGTRQAAVLRLPLQVPMLWAAWRIRQRSGGA